MIEILILTSKIIFLLFISGLGVSAIILPDFLRRGMFWIVPWVGTIMITILSVYLSMMGVSMRQGSYILLFLFLLFFIYSLKKRNKLYQKPSHQTLVLGILTGVILIINLLPMMSRVGFATTISLGNLDPLAYVHSEEYLIDHTVFEKFTDSPLIPSSSAASDIVSYSFRWGVALIFSFFGSLLKVQGYQLFSILIAVYFAITYPLVYYLAKFLFEKKSISWPILMLVVFLTYGINSTLLYMVYNAFFGQVVFAGVFCLFLILFINLKKSKRLSLIPTRLEFMLAATLSSITTLYPDGFILVYLPLLGWAIFSSLFKKKVTAIISAFRITSYAILINPFTAYTTYGWIQRMIKVTTAYEKIGWEPIRYSLPFEFLGFHNLYYSRDLPLSIDLVLGTMLIIVMGIGFYKIRDKLLLANYIVCFLSFNAFFYFIRPNFFVYHRTITYSLFIYSTLLAIGLVVFLQALNNKKITMIVVIVVFFLSSRSAYRTYFQFYHHMRVVDRPLISLGDLNVNRISDPIITSDVYSPNYDVWVRLWREYFLKDKKIITTSNFSSVQKIINDNTLYLSEKDLANSYSPALLISSTVWENEYYKLGKRCSGDACMLKSNDELSVIDFRDNAFQDSLIGEGWSIREEGHRWISSSEAQLKLITKTKPQTLEMVLSSLEEPQTFSVNINGSYLGKANITNKFTEYSFPVRPFSRVGVNVIKMIFSNGYSPSIVSGTSDTRMLYGNFSRIQLK